MNPRLNPSVTLIELIVAISLIGMVILVMANIELFSRYQVLSVERRTIQNEVSHVLEHMSKQIILAIGEPNHPAAIYTNSFGVRKLSIWKDRNQNGARDIGDEPEVSYEWPGPPELYYNYWDPANPMLTQRDTLSRHITGFNCQVNGNTVELDITACYDPDGDPYTCGSRDNPTVNMRTRVRMPSVSGN